MLIRYIGIWLAASLLAAAPAIAEPSDLTLIVIVSGHAPVTVTNADLAKLPAVGLSASFKTEQGVRTGSFTGPLLWSVLTQSGAVDAEKHQDAVRQAVLITGQDGYVAVLALAEIAPEFEGKQVILATSADNKPLDGHWRLVVPADQRGGRSVRDVVRIVIVSLASAHP